MAVGVVAVGQHATGVIAIGGIATGFVAFGQVSTGVVAIGQLARGGIAVGQLAIGLAAIGQLAIGVAWVGGLGIGATRGFGVTLGLFPETAVNSARAHLRWRWNQLRGIPDDQPIVEPDPPWRIPAATLGTAALSIVWWFIAGRAMIEAVHG
ncbi:hypothetical protein [Nocardia sp. NPDC051981]|uniref:hypothetical protein n=1 Tax=Nocardia sp. NPDC051981 TaxID=3155417 RepID=UPI00343DAA31